MVIDIDHLRVEVSELFRALSTTFSLWTASDVKLGRTHYTWGAIYVLSEIKQHFSDEWFHRFGMMKYIFPFRSRDQEREGCLRLSFPNFRTKRSYAN